MNKNAKNILQIKTCEELLNEYRKSNRRLQSRGELLSFDVENDLEKITVYNITKPIIKNKKRYLIGRVEPIDSELSKVMFFEENEGKWQTFDHPVFDLQDPFYIENVQGWQVLGGVQIDPNIAKFNYRTVFYRYEKCATELVWDGKLLPPFAISPIMKDIRLIDLKNGRIAVFTRPQGGKAGLGKIGYIEIESLDDLEQAIPKAVLIDNQFADNEWGGANELHLLKDGKIGVLGHIAHFEGKVKHYYSMYFIFDPSTKTSSKVKILSTADEFPNVKSKNDQLGKILFSGGLHRKNDGTADLFVGIGDVRAGFIQILDPFA